MTLENLLWDNREPIVKRWFEDVLATYPGDSFAALARQEDPFANPVGHRLRVGTRGVFEALLRGQQGEEIQRHLQEIVGIRAVQQFTASQAVGFVFRLKEAVRAVLADAIDDARLAAELAEFERQVDRVALTAFDIFVECRERVSQLRVNEVKRQVSWIVDRLNRRGHGAEVTQVGPGEA